MTTRDATVAVRLGFMPSSQAIPDADHPGLLRAGPRSSGPYGGESVEYHTCSATDACQDHTVRPDLLELGFDSVDLSALDGLQQVLRRVAEAGHLTDADEAAIRASLQGATLPLSGGASATVLHIADEGLHHAHVRPERHVRRRGHGRSA